MQTLLFKRSTLRVLVIAPLHSAEVVWVRSLLTPYEWFMSSSFKAALLVREANAARAQQAPKIALFVHIGHLDKVSGVAIVDLCRAIIEDHFPVDVRPRCVSNCPSPEL